MNASPSIIGILSVKYFEALAGIKTSLGQFFSIVPLV